MNEQGSSAPHPFFNPVGATKNLRSLEEMFLASGSGYQVDRFTDLLRTHLSSAPDPDMALTNLLRFAESSLSRSSLFNDLLRYPVLMEVLVRVLGASRYFGDILVRDPELFRWLTASDSLLTPRPKESLEADAVRTLGMFRSMPKKLDALRRFYRREILRIGTRDILGNADVSATTQSLSNLADVLVHATYTVARDELNERHGSPPATPFAVIGLGKLGGGELNYSSDIDIMFVYGDEGEIETVEGRHITHHEYFNKLAGRIIVHLSASSAEGHLYRVDTRLRPEGGVSPLARSVQSFLLYYERRGELWERQMLIKARPVAGDPEFGSDFLNQLDPFVYPRTLFQHPAESIARLKARMEAAVAGEENIKLRAGGIRDIEFVTQTLQLLNGGRNRLIRSGNTLHAIEQLTAERLIGADERPRLVTAYIFFRAVEHTLQTMLNTQTHTLPGDMRTQSVVARRLGLASSEELRQMIDTHLKNVREIYDDVLSVSTGSEERGLETLFEGLAGEADVESVLMGYRFSDVRSAAKHIAALLMGSRLTGESDFDGRVRDAFKDIAGDLLKHISDTVYPDLTLRNLAAITSSQKFPELLYAQLKESGFRNLILGICAVSPRFVKSLSRDPLLAEMLASNPDALSSPQGAWVPDQRNIVSHKLREETRAGIRNILKLITFDEMTEELSSIADAVVSHVFETECGKVKRRAVPMAVFALGKLGTREITFDADLDLLFVTGSDSATTKERLERIAQAVVNQLGAVSEEGKLYDIDVRLRPEGKNAPLVVDADAYRTYLHRRASLWERQSLTRLRWICGDQRVGGVVKGVVDKFVYGTPLQSDWVKATIAMRRKTESRSRANTPGFLDFKLGSGGMVDIEFLSQMIQLKFGKDRPTLRGKATAGVLTESVGLFLSEDEASFMTGAYSTFREIEKHMRITLEDRGSILPEGDKLELLARCVGESNGADLSATLNFTMNTVRRQFLYITERLSS